MIRLMEIDDLDQVLKIENSLFSDAWSKDNFIYELTSNEFSKSYVFDLDGIIVGYAILYILFERAEVASIAVDEKYQSLGYGKKLLEYIIDEANNNSCEFMSLEVRVSNLKAQTLYQKYGFEILRTRKSYYSDNYEDAYEMFKVLGGYDEKDICD